MSAKIYSYSVFQQAQERVKAIKEKRLSKPGFYFPKPQPNLWKGPDLSLSKETLNFMVSTLIDGNPPASVVTLPNPLDNVPSWVRVVDDQGVEIPMHRLHSMLSEFSATFKSPEAEDEQILCLCPQCSGSGDDEL